MRTDISHLSQCRTRYRSRLLRHCPPGIQRRELRYRLYCAVAVLNGCHTVHRPRLTAVNAFSRAASVPVFAAPALIISAETAMRLPARRSVFFQICSSFNPPCLLSNHYPSLTDFHFNIPSDSPQKAVISADNPCTLYLSWSICKITAFHRNCNRLFLLSRYSFLLGTLRSKISQMNRSFCS